MLVATVPPLPPSLPLVFESLPSFPKGPRERVGFVSLALLTHSLDLARFLRSQN